MSIGWRFNGCLWHGAATGPMVRTLYYVTVLLYSFLQPLQNMPGAANDIQV